MKEGVYIMFLGTIENAITVANENIPIVTEIATNRKVVNNTATKALEVRKVGIYKLSGYLQIIGGTGDVDINILEDSDIKRTITVTLATATTVLVVPILDVFKCVSAEYPSVGTLSIQSATSGLTIDGLVSVEYIQ